MRQSFTRIFIFCVIQCLCAGTESIASRQETADNDSAETAWQGLQSKFPRRRPAPAQAMQSAPRQQPAATTEPVPFASASEHTVQENQPSAHSARADWRELARESRDFVVRHPGSKHINEVRKLELTAELIPLRGRGCVPPEIQSKIDAYLADPSIPAAERYDISAMHKEARLELRVGMRMEEITDTRLENARALAAEFPYEPRAWTSLLNAARNVSLRSVAEVAAQIVKSPQAPDYVKRGAQLLLDKHALLGKAPAGIDLSSASGRPVLLYFWTLQQPQFIGFLRLCAEIDGIALIGINIDEDETAAREFAAMHSPPGRQFYEGVGSPAAKRLHVSHFPAMLVLDQNGVLLDYPDNTYGAFDEMKQLAGHQPPA